jgi:DNA-binding HxlR family transcriptional regulator
LVTEVLHCKRRDLNMAQENHLEPLPAPAFEGHAPGSEVGVCPMDAVLKLLMGPWTTYIIWLLETQGPLRFGEIKTRMPAISSKVLTERLRHLEAARIVSRDYRPTIPPQVSYALTPRGHELKNVLGGISIIAQRWQVEDAAVTPGRLV